MLAVARGVFGNEGKPPAGGVELWDVSGGRTDRRIAILGEPAHASVFALAFSPDGKWLACGSGCLNATIGKPTVTVIETKTWTVRKQFECDGEGILALGFAPGNRYLVAGLNRDGGGALEIWDGGDWSAEPKRLARRTDFSETVNGIAFLAGSSPRFATSSWSKAVQFWSLHPDRENPLEEEPELPKRSEIAAPIIDMAASRDGKWVGVATTSSPRQIATWKSGTEFRMISPEDAADYCSLAFLPNGAGIAAGDRDGRVRVFNLPDLKERPLALKPLAGQVWGLVCSPDGKWLAAAGQSTGLRQAVALIPTEGLTGK